MKLEQQRQTQKTVQNAIGSFHENILGSVKGWVNLDPGMVIDLENKKEKVIAEVKNKYNTTKGNHKVRIYDDLKSSLDDRYEGFTGFYVEIIPKSKKRYNKPFTPPDNTQKGKRRPKREDIRLIDGYSFYELVTGKKDSLKAVYIALAEVLSRMELIDKNGNIEELFDKAF